MSSRSLLAALSSTGTGVTDRTTMRCPQCGQGRRKLGKCEGTMFLTDTGAFPFPPAPYRAISFRFGTRVNKILCDAQHWRRLYRASQTISTSLDFAWVHHYIPSDLGKHSGPTAGLLSTPARPSRRFRSCERNPACNLLFCGSQWLRTWQRCAGHCGLASCAVARAAAGRGHDLHCGPMPRRVVARRQSLDLLQVLLQAPIRSTGSVHLTKV